MEIVQIRLGGKAQVVIPKKAREAIGLIEGKLATLVYEEGRGILLGDPKSYGRRKIISILSSPKFYSKNCYQNEELNQPARPFF